MSTESKKIVLRSNDGEIFEVDISVAQISDLIKHTIKDTNTDNGIPLPNITGQILAKVIEYCKRHADPAASEDELKIFDEGFLKVKQTVIYELILAAGYLGIEGLYDLTTQFVADMMKDMSLDEVRKMFSLKDDLSPDEKDEIRKDNAKYLHI